LKINEISNIDLAKVIRNMENDEKKYKNNIVCFTKQGNAKWDPQIYNDHCKIFLNIIYYYLI
jgi:hypothetical protein